MADYKERYLPARERGSGATASPAQNSSPPASKTSPTIKKSIVLPAPSGNSPLPAPSGNSPSPAPSGNSPLPPASKKSVVLPVPSGNIIKKTMKRLKGFDYRKPYFYMVTIRRRKGLRAFSQITGEVDPPKDAKGRPCYLVANEITDAFTSVIRNFAGKWWGLWPIDCFAVMPDHIHLLIHIKDTGDQLPLGKYVYQLMKALSAEYWRICGGATASPTIKKSIVLPVPSGNIASPAPSGNIPPAPSVNSPFPPLVFEHDWHDWIVKKDGQLAAFTCYVRENAERTWLRRVNRKYFGRVRKVSFLGREWFAYGNTAILELPVLVAVKGHRATKPGSAEWEAMVESCSRIGPGGAGVGTFMSPLEKECGNAIASAGGKWVVLTPEGFYDRWHPPREKERFCAEGRMLFLSLYPPMNRLPTKSELYRRCHEMGDIVMAGLGKSGATASPTIKKSIVLPAPSGNIPPPRLATFPLPPEKPTPK